MRKSSMDTKPVTVQVEAQVADAYDSASWEERQKMQRMVSLYLRYLTAQPDQTLLEAMREAREEAAANGLTPEILEEILSEQE